MQLLWFNLRTDADDPVLGFTTSWIRSVARHVSHVDVVTMSTGRVDVPENVSVFSVGKERGYNELRRTFEFYRILGGLTRSTRYDACFAHMMPLFAVLGAPILAVRGIPITLWYAHRTVTPLLRCAAMASRQVVTSSLEGFRLAHRRVIVTGQGIDTDTFGPAAPDTRPQGTFIIAVVGRLSPIKRVELVIEAARQIVCVHGFRGLRVRVIGPVLDAEYAEQLARQVRAAALEDHVEFVGAVPFGQVATAYRSADLIASFSDTGSLDKVELEAMSCGVPIVTSNQAFRAALGDLGPELVLSAPDPNELARRVLVLAAESPERRFMLSSRIRAFVVERHGLERLGHRLASEILPRRNGAVSPGGARLNGRSGT